MLTILGRKIQVLLMDKVGDTYEVTSVDCDGVIIHLLLPDGEESYKYYPIDWEDLKDYEVL